jgi:NAD(P)-dependent dehydrogenase (short-subunit alcohol dehydrogenase family)
MADLEKLVAVVAGASRGAGRGIAVSLGERGATVYVAGRTSRTGARPMDGAPGTVEDTAEEITRRGGRGIAVVADCTDGEQVAALFQRVAADHGRLDVLANAVWGMSDGYPTSEDLLASWGQPFWEQPAAAWHQMMDAGPRAYFLASSHAVRLMAKQPRGLIVGVTDGHVATAAGQDPYGMGHGQLLWHLAHHSIDLMLKGMAIEAKKRKIAVVTLMPGFMRTERVLRTMTTDKLKKQFGFEHSESTEYIGRAVAALAADPKVLAKSGKVHFVADLAREYGFTDVDGRQVPRFNPFG